MECLKPLWQKTAPHSRRRNLQPLQTNTLVTRGVMVSSNVWNSHYQVVREQMVKDKNRMCEHFNKTARDLPSLLQSQRVYVQVHKSVQECTYKFTQCNQWISATVTKTPVASQPRSYSVETTEGAQLVKNRSFIRPAQEIAPIPAENMKRGDSSSS